MTREPSIGHDEDRGHQAHAISASKRMLTALFQHHPERLAPGQLRPLLKILLDVGNDPLSDIAILKAQVADLMSSSNRVIAENTKLRRLLEEGQRTLRRLQEQGRRALRRHKAEYKSLALRHYDQDQINQGQHKKPGAKDEADEQDEQD